MRRRRRRAKVSAHQLIAAEDVPRQEAVAVVATVKEASFPFPVNPIIRGIEVENQFLRWALVRRDELIGEHLRHPNECLMGDGVLESTKGRR